MTAESHELLKQKNKLFKAWDAKDTATAQEIEAAVDDKAKIAAWKKQYQRTPQEALGAALKKFKEAKDLGDAADRADTPEERALVRQAITHKMASSRTLKPEDRKYLKSILDKLKAADATN